MEGTGFALRVPSAEQADDGARAWLVPASARNTGRLEPRQGGGVVARLILPAP